MKIKSSGSTLAVLVLTLFFGAGGRALQASQDRPRSASVTDAAIPGSQLLQPAELVQLLRSPGEKPQILQVGSHVLYAEAHIPGAAYLGAGGQDSGLQALRDGVKSFKHDRFLVIYCGCCPWDKCPNIRPAYRQLIGLGFTNVKVLYLAENFGAPRTLYTIVIFFSFSFQNRLLAIAIRRCCARPGDKRGLVGRRPRLPRRRRSASTAAPGERPEDCATP